MNHIWKLNFIFKLCLVKHPK